MTIRKIYEAEPRLMVEISGDNVKQAELEVLHKYFKEDVEIMITNTVIANIDMQSDGLKKFTA